MSGSIHGQDAPLGRPSKSEDAHPQRLMAKAKEKLVWSKVPESMLTKEQAKKAAKVREVMAELATAKKAFNTDFIAMVTAKGKVPVGKKAVISHGKFKPEIKIAFATPGAGGEDEDEFSLD